MPIRTTPRTARRASAVPVALALILLAFAPVAVPVTAPAAAELRMGMQNIPTLDPHFLLLDSNIAYNQHIYGALTDTDEQGRLVPDLAESWTSDGKDTWRFALRRGVTFHDGTSFTADDVVYSLNRVPNVPNNPAPYTSQVLGIREVRRVDDHTVDVVTDAYNPLLPVQLAKLHMMSRQAAERRSTPELNAGQGAVGTGPYRVTQVQGKERVFLERFDRYWGTKPDWDRLEWRVLPNDGARTAALLSGDVDLIEFVPLQDSARLASTPGLALHSGGSARVMYVGLNLDPKPEPPGPNPMRDPRVRRAVSLAVNRDGMVRSILLGTGRVASQLAVPGMNGYLDGLRPDPYAPDEARKLLAEAGYPDGFSTSILCPSGRYVADAQVCQAMGQMLARIGIKASVEAVPASVFFSRVRTGNNPAPLFLSAWSNVMGDASYTLNNIYHTFDPARKMGTVNRTGWSDAEADRTIDAALSEPDPARRLELLRSAWRRVTEAGVTVPLFSAPVLLASKAGIRYDVGSSGSSEMTSAMRAHPR